MFNTRALTLAFLFLTSFSFALDVPPKDDPIVVPIQSEQAPTYKYFRITFTSLNTAYLVIPAIRYYDEDGRQFSPSNYTDVNNGLTDDPTAPLSTNGMLDFSDRGYVASTNAPLFAIGYEAYRVFGASVWIINALTPSYLTLELPLAKSISKYSISITNNNGWGTYYPKTWTIYGSNTGAFSGEEKVLHEVTNYDFPQPANATQTTVLWRLPNGSAEKLY